MHDSYTHGVLAKATLSHAVKYLITGIACNIDTFLTSVCHQRPQVVARIK